MPTRKPMKAPTIMGEAGARLRTTIPGKRSIRKRGPDPAPLEQTRLAREREKSVDRAERTKTAARKLKRGGG